MLGSFEVSVRLREVIETSTGVCYGPMVSLHLNLFTMEALLFIGDFRQEGPFRYDPKRARFVEQLPIFDLSESGDEGTLQNNIHMQDLLEAEMRGALERAQRQANNHKNRRKVKAGNHTSILFGEAAEHAADWDGTDSDEYRRQPSRPALSVVAELQAAK